MDLGTQLSRISRHKSLFVLLLLAAALIGSVVVQGELNSFANDAGSYLLMARQWSPWFTPGQAELLTSPLVAYPPGYPALLAITGASHNIYLAQLIGLTCLLGFAITLFRWLHTHLGETYALLGTTLFLFAPGTTLNLLSPVAEFPYLLLSGLVFLQLQERTKLSVATAMLALLSVLLLTRSAGIALIAALLLARVDTSLKFAALLSLLPAIAWSLLSAASGENGGESYLEALVSVDITGLLVSTIQNLISLPMAFHEFIAGPAGFTALQLISLPLFLVLVSCALIRAWQRKVDGLYCVIYLGMLSLWPYTPGSRLLLPVLPFLLIQPLMLKKRQLNYLAVVLLLPLLLGQAEMITRWLGTPSSTVHSIESLGDPDRARGELNRDIYAAIRQQMRESSRFTEPGARVASVKPAFFAVIADRPATALSPSPSWHCHGETPDYVFVSALTSGYNQAGLQVLEAYLEYLENVTPLPAGESAPNAYLARLRCP